MKKIQESVLRLLSVRNLIAVTIAYLFEVKFLYLILRLFYWIINGIFNHNSGNHWIVSEHWLKGIVAILFVIHVATALVCQIKIDVGSSSKQLEKFINGVLTFPMWFGFAVMCLLLIPTVYVISLLRKLASKYRTVWFILDILYFLIVQVAVFCLGTRQVVSGKFPDQQGFWEDFWLTLKKKKDKIIKKYLVNLGHYSFADYFLWLLGLGLRRVRIVAGKNLLKFPVIGSLIKSKAILVDRENPVSIKESGEEMMACLQQGDIVGYSPFAGRMDREELGVLRDISKWPDGPFIMSRRLKIPIVPVNITETGTFRPPLKRAIPKAPRSFIKRTVQVIRVIKKTKRLFKKIAMMFCGIVIVLNAFIQFVKWLVFILMNYQWYCFFVETYFDILDPIYPDNLSTQELKQKVFDSMEKQICERLLWIENKKMDEQKTKDVIFKLILFTVVFLTFIYLLSK